MTQVKFIPQMFILMKDGKVNMISAKVMDDKKLLEQN